MIKKIKKYNRGNVQFYFATIKNVPREHFNANFLKDFIKERVKALRLTIRKIQAQSYGRRGAMTVVAFLNESHLIITTYPEHRIAELEFASCRKCETCLLFPGIIGTVDDKYLIEKNTLDERWIRMVP
jgi:S-adenosylmethionine/arginine decarboxylase-like enzyme